MWKRVLEGTGQAVGEPHCVTDHTATVLDELCEGAQGGALRPERLRLVAMGEQQCALEGGVRRGVFGPAGRAGFAIPRPPQGIDGEEDQKVILAPGRDQRAFVEFETHGHGWASEPRAPCGAPRVNGRGGVLELEVCTFCGVSRLEADIMLGVSPVNTNKGRKGFGGCMCHALSPRVC